MIYAEDASSWWLSYRRKWGPSTFCMHASTGGQVSTHSMRRTKVAQIYKKAGNLRAVQMLLGLPKMDSSVRYIGVDFDDALTQSEGIDL